MEDYTIKPIQGYKYKGDIYALKESAIRKRKLDLSALYASECQEMLEVPPLNNRFEKEDIRKLPRILDALETDGIEEVPMAAKPATPEPPFDVNDPSTWPDKWPMLCWDKGDYTHRILRFCDATNKCTFADDGLKWDRYHPISETLAAELFGGLEAYNKAKSKLED